MIHFEISDNQEKKLNEWRENHTCAIRKQGGFRYAGTFGEVDTFRFVPTSLGDVITTVTCACGEKIDLTEWND